jgi:cell wall-associated NlpC family hydrolase
MGPYASAVDARRNGLCLMAAPPVVLAPGTAAGDLRSPKSRNRSTRSGTLNLSSDFNRVHSSLQANKAKVAELEKTLKPLELQVDLALSRVSGIAVQAYKAGSASTLSALLNSGSPDSLLDQLSVLNQMSRKQLADISTVKETRNRFLADKQALDALVTQLTAQDADLAGKKKSIESQIASLQTLRQKVYGTAGSTGDLKPVNCPFEYVGGAAGAAATKACQQISKRYVYGAAGPSTFDCSGLTMYAWAGGKSLPHNAADQYKQITHVTRANLRTGDLVFYGSPIHHVSLYVGGGWVVHAPRTGDVVRMAKIDGPGSPSGYGRPAS